MAEDGPKCRRTSLNDKLPNVLVPPISWQRSVSSERSPRNLGGIAPETNEELRRTRSFSNSSLPNNVISGGPLPPSLPRQRGATITTTTTPKRRERRQSLGLSSGHGGLLQFQEQLRRKTGTTTQRRRSLGEEGPALTISYSPARTLHTKVFVPYQKADGCHHPVTHTALRAKRYLNLLSEEKGSANVRVLGMHSELLNANPEADINDLANESLIQLQHGMSLVKCIRIWFEVSGGEEACRNSFNGSTSRRTRSRSMSESEREEEEFGIMPEPDTDRCKPMKSPRRPRAQTGLGRYVEEDFVVPPTRDTSMSDSYAYVPQRYGNGEAPRRRATLTAAPDEKTAELLNSSGDLELAFPKLGREISDRTKMIGGQIMRDDYLQLHAEKQKLKDLLRRQQITTEEYRRMDREVAQKFQRTYAGTLGIVRNQLEKMKLILREKEPLDGVDDRKSQ